MKQFDQERGNQARFVSPELEQNIRRRAYEIYEEHGRIGGSEMEDWLQAESEVLGKKSEFEVLEKKNVGRVRVA